MGRVRKLLSKKPWRAGWFNRLLGIHLPIQHAMETCWCIGTKRQMANPEHFYTASQARAEMRAYAEYFNAVLELRKETDDEDPS